MPQERITAIDCDRFDESNLVNMGKENLEIMLKNGWVDEQPSSSTNLLLRFNKKGIDLCAKIFRLAEVV